MASWYAIRARATGAEVAIYDEIGAYGVSAKGFLAELGALPEGTPIDLRLNSPGGSVDSGMAIYDTMNYISNDVATVAMGLAASMGQFLLTAGTKGKRYALPHAKILMHQPLGGVGGGAGRRVEFARVVDLEHFG